MKFKTKANELTSAVKTVLAVHDFGDSSSGRQPCVITATEDGLRLESSKLGAYVAKLIPGTLLRAGSVGVNAKDLSMMKLRGDVVVEVDDDAVKFTDGKTAYRWAIDSAAEHDVNEQKDASAQVKPAAKIPALALKAGATFATYRSEMKGDHDVQITIDKGYLEYCGLDAISYGRYEFRNKNVRAKQRFHFILGNSILEKVLKEIDSAEVVVGVSDDGGLIRISSNDLDLYHPAIDKKYQDTTAMINTVTGSKDSRCVCRFVVKRNEMKDAVERVAPLAKKDPDATMLITIKGDEVTVRQHAQANAAACRVSVENAKAAKNVKILVRTKYLQEFLKAAPPTTPLLVESWNKQFLRIRVDEDHSTIDYMAMMVSE